MHVLSEVKQIDIEVCNQLGLGKRSSVMIHKMKKIPLQISMDEVRVLFLWRFKNAMFVHDVFLTMEHCVWFRNELNCKM